jgi:hypothetical protein
MKRLLALMAGGLGLGAILKRRSRPAASPSPAEDLRAKLARTKAEEAPPTHESASVDDRRADVHAKARQAIDDLGAP